jgi:hypothetical protein
MARRNLILVSVLVAAAAVMLPLLLDGSSRRAPDRDDGDVGAREGTTPDLLRESPELLGRQGADAEAPEDAPPTEAEPAPTFTHVLVGTVGGLQPGEAAATRVSVHRLYHYGWVNDDVPALHGAVAADGTFEVDVSSFFEAGNPPTQIQATFDHPAYALLKHKVRMQDGKPRGPDGPVEVRADVTLVRALVVEGQITSEVGDPLEGVQVALLEREGEGFRRNAVDDLVAPEVAKSDPDGRFRLRSPRPGRFLVATLSRTWLPACREVRLELGVRLDPVLLRLTPGLRIAGRVTVNGRPLPKARVEAERLEAAQEMRFRFHAFVWREGRLWPGERYAETDERGRYVVTGLDPGAWTLALGYVHSVHLWRSFHRAGARQVEPPVEGTDFDIQAVEVEVRVLSGAEPVKDPTVTIVRPGEEDSAHWTSQRSVVRAIVPADTTLVAKVTHDRYATKLQEFRTQSAGTKHVEVVDLGPPRDLATLVVALTDTEGRPIDRATFEFQPLDGHGRLAFGMTDPERSADGVYRLEDLEPGRKALFVLPGRSDMDFTGYFLMLREEVDLVAGRETRLTLKAALGGRLRVAVRDEEGKLLDAYAVLRDARGRKLEVSYVSGGENFASMSSGGPGTGSPSVVEPPLEPGEYRIELSVPGRESKTLDVKVDAGKTTDVDVTLRKR